MLKRRTIKAKIFFTFIFLLATFFCLQTFYIGPKLERNYRNVQENYQSGIANNIAQFIDMNFQRYKVELELLAQTPSITSMDKKEIDRALSHMDNLTQFFDYFFVTDTEGKWVSYPSKPHLVGKQIPNVSWIKKTIATNQTHYLDILPAKVINTLVSGFSTPIRNGQNKTIGILRGVITISQENALLEMIKGFKIGENGFVFLVDSNGRPLAHPDFILEFDSFENFSLNDLAPVQKSLSGKSGHIEYEYNNREYIASYRPIKTTNWGIIIQQPLDDILLYVKNETKTATYIHFILFPLILLILWFLANRALKPMTMLLKSIQSKNFKPYANYPDDEIGQLAKEIESLFFKMNETQYALEESEEKFRMIANKSNDMIHVNDLEGNLLYVNPATERLLGHSMEEMLNKHANGFVHPDDRETVRDEMEDMMKGRQGDAPTEIRLLKADGTYLDVEVNGFVIQLSDGKKQLGAVIRDITFRRVAEEALNNAYKDLEKVFSERTKELSRSEERYRTLFENATDVIQIVRPDGQLNYVNPSWCSSMGYSQEEIQDLNVFDLIHPECQDECELHFNRAITEGTTGIIETIFRSKDGRKVILQGSANSKKINGEPSFVHCIFHDITEQRRMEEELAKMHKLESIGILAGGIAHDFNNILTALTGNLSLARMYAEPGSKIYKRIKKAEKASLSASNLTQQLLTFSKGGAPIKQTVSITEIINDSCQFVLRGSNVKCEFDLADDLWQAEVDEGQINQVMHNLVINADHAMPDGGTITIHADNIHIKSTEHPPLKGGNYVVVSVEDNGSGISNKYINKIFDPYFTTKHKGHGLGLATAYSIVKKHGGLLEAKSELDKGAIFKFYLPASLDRDNSQTAAKESIHIVNGSILLMDDDDEVRETGREMLEHLGYDVKTASDGIQALEIFNRAVKDNTSFDVIIMDLTIPGGMGGKETMEQLLEIDPSATVIVSSGYSNDPIMADYKLYGFSGVIPKPYKIEDLSRVLQGLL